MILYHILSVCHLLSYPSTWYCTCSGSLLSTTGTTVRSTVVEYTGTNSTVLVPGKVLEGPAIRAAIVTKERCEPAGRELVSVRVQAGAKSVVTA